MNNCFLKLYRKVIICLIYIFSLNKYISRFDLDFWEWCNEIGWYDTSKKVHINSFTPSGTHTGTVHTLWWSPCCWRRWWWSWGGSQSGQRAGCCPCFVLFFILLCSFFISLQQPSSASTVWRKALPWQMNWWIFFLLLYINGTQIQEHLGFLNKSWNM